MRRKADPVDAAFDFWRGLTPEQRAAFGERVTGFHAASGGAPPPVRTRQRKVNGAANPQREQYPATQSSIGITKGGAGVLPPKTA